jgi:threonine dehydrogenase-like Zn-dependent dehydrogenase
MTDRLDYRVAVASKAGASWAGNPDREDIVRAILKRQPAGLDVVYECAGQQETLDQAVELLKPGGKLMVLGIPRVERVSFKIERLRRKEVTLINVRRQNQCVQSALDMLASSAFASDFMITHCAPPAQAQRIFDLVAGYRDGVIKAVIEFP